MSERKVTITDDSILFEGFTLPADVPDLDVPSVHSLRALVWAIERIVQATAKIECEHKRKNEVAAQTAQALQRMRSGLH